MRRRDIAMALIGRKVPRPGAKRRAPDHGIATVAVMPEPQRAVDFWHVARDHRGIAAKPVAGQHQRLAPQRFGPARCRNRDALDRAGIGEKPGRPAVADDVDAPRLARRPQPIHQILPGPGWQPVHPAPRMPGVVEIVNQRKRHLEPLGQPLNRRARPACQGVDQVLGVLARGLGLDIGRKDRGRVGAPCRGLMARAGGRAQPGG